MQNKPQKKSSAAAPVIRPRLLNVNAAASYLATTIWNIRSLTWSGRLKPVKLGGARLLFDIHDLDAFVEQVKAAAAEQGS